MADCTPKKLTDLDPLSLPIEGTDLFFVVRPSGDPGNQLSFSDLLAQIPGGSAVWGAITGDIDDQTDLFNELQLKAVAGPLASGASGLTSSGQVLLGRYDVGEGVIQEIQPGNSLQMNTGELDVFLSWGEIQGTLADQDDLQAALDLKANVSDLSGYVKTDQTSPQTIGATGARLAKLWATDLTVTNAIAGSVTGNAATATVLATPRNINGVSFNGSADITVTAAASTLSGTTLASGVVTSSLTTVGALASGSLATGFVVGGVTMTLGSDASFDLYYRNGSGVLTRLGMGTTGQFLAANTGAAPTWGTPAGAGTVTHTGNLTSNAVVLGNGTADVTVAAGITTDGTSALILGVNTTTLGKVKMFGNTSGDVTIQPNAVAGTGIVLTLPATTDTLVGKTTTDTLTNKTLTSPVVNGLTSSGSTSIDFSGNSGTFKTTTGATTLGSSATVNGVILAPEIQQNLQTSNYTCVLADANKHIYDNTGGSGLTWTIPANASVAYPIGTTLTFVEASAGGTRTIAITSDTLLGAGSLTGSRTLTGQGVATALKIATTQWLITGVGLT